MCSLKSEFEILHESFQEIKFFQKSNNFEMAKSIIDQMIERLENYEKLKLQDPGFTNNSLFLRLLAMKNTLFYEKSKVLVSLQEDNEAMEILESALVTIRDFISKFELIYLVLRIINHYAYLLIKKDDFEKVERNLILEINFQINTIFSIKFI